jgi:hypothetical protein
MDQFELSADTTVVFNGYSRGGLRAIDCFLATAFRLPNVFVCTCNPFVWPAAVKLIQLRVGPLVRLSDRMFTARVDCDIGLGHKLPGTVRRIASRLPRTASRLDKTKAAHSLMNPTIRAAPISLKKQDDNNNKSFLSFQFRIGQQYSICNDRSSKRSI